MICYSPTPKVGKYFATKTFCIYSLIFSCVDYFSGLLQTSNHLNLFIVTVLCLRVITGANTGRDLAVFEGSLIRRRLGMREAQVGWKAVVPRVQTPGLLKQGVEPIRKILFN